MRRILLYLLAQSVASFVTEDAQSQNIIVENFQTWSVHNSYGSYTQAGSGGAWNMVQCIVSPTGAGIGTGSDGYVQMKGSAGALFTLPQLASGGATSITFTMEVSTVSGASIQIEKQIGAGGWTTVQTINSGLSTTTQTYTVNINDNSASLTLRFNNNGIRQDVIHDVSVQLTGATDISSYIYRTKGSGNWSQTSPVVWERSGDGGTTWNDVTNSIYLPNYTNGSITVSSGNSITVSTPIYLDQTTVQSGATVTTGSGVDINVLDGTGTDLDIYGTVVMTASRLLYGSTGTPAACFRSGAFYKAIDQASNIPTTANTTWDANSTLEIAGTMTAAPGFSNLQTYGNMVWNATGSTGIINLNATLVNLGGYFKLSSSGTGSLRLNGLSGVSLTIGGDFIMEGGKMDFNNGSGTTTLNVSGNINITGGTFGFATMTPVTINMNGSSKTLVCTPSSFAGSASLTMNISASADYTLSGSCNISAGKLNINGTLTTQANQVTGTGTVTISNKLITANAGGLSGNSSSAINGPALNTLGSISIIEYNSAGAQIITGRTDYYNVILTNAGTKTLNGNTTISNILQINAGDLSISSNTLTLNGTVTGNGTLSGTGSSGLTIGGSSGGSLGTLVFTAGSQNLNILTVNRTGVGANAATVLGSDLTVKSFILTNGIVATDNYLLTWDNTGALTSPNNPWAANQTNFSNSYIATCDANGNTPSITTPFDGSKGFRVNNMGTGTNINFPVGADFTSANRMLISNSGTADNFTVVVAKGDIGNTPLPRINRIWYVHATNGAGIRATMELFFTKWNWSATHFGSGQDETEDGFLYDDVHLVQEDYTNQFVNNSQTGTSDITDFSNNTAYNYGSEIFGKFSAASIDLSGNNNGVTGFTRFSVVNANGIVLPVTITNFTARMQGGSVKLGWTGADETNIDHYEIERSRGGNNFIMIASLPALNNGSQANYIITDTQPLAGNNYYRIKAIDRAGKFIYSSIEKINFANSKPGIHLYPNPIKGFITTVGFSNMEEGNYFLILCSNNGQKIWQKNIQHRGGSAVYTIQLPAGFAKGIYHLIIRGNDFKISKILLVE